MIRGGIRWLVNNVGIIFLSLVLAVSVWAVAEEQDDPTLEQRYSVPIPITIPDPPDGMVVYGQVEEEVHVTLRAPRSVWDDLNPEDVRASIDLEGLGEGEHWLPIKVQVDLRPVMVLQVEPPTLLLHLEQAAEDRYPVEVSVEGSPAQGYAARDAVVTPLTVTVSGAASFVSRIDQVVTRISIAGEREDVVGEFPLLPLDAEGLEVPHVTLTPTLVNVRVSIEQMSGFKDLAVRAQLEGQVASGYRIAGLTVDPPVVTVLVRQDIFDEVPNYVRTAPVNIEGAWEDVFAEVPLQLREGVVIVGERDTVGVLVSIVPREGTRVVERQVEIQGWGPGITATVVPTTVQVILSGPLPVLEQLKEEDVRVIVDLFGLNAGTHDVMPRLVVVPTEEVVGSVLPSTVRVEIEPRVTPTP